MAGLLLYSTNPWFAHEISQNYLGGNHVIWCSDSFEGSKAPSSSPEGILTRLSEDIYGRDEHSPFIDRYEKSFKALAKKLCLEETISEKQRNEILSEIKAKKREIWRPVVYLIPRHKIPEERLELVERKKRASDDLEYRIKDLHTNEFDIIEGLYDSYFRKI